MAVGARDAIEATTGVVTKAATTKAIKGTDADARGEDCALGASQASATPWEAASCAVPLGK